MNLNTQSSDRNRTVFRPAISAKEPSVERHPAWYIGRVSGPFATKLRSRLFDLVNLPYLDLQMEIPRHHRSSTFQSYFPGYFFLQFDIETDFWQQVLDIPGIMGFVGAPTPIPDATINDLMNRCKRHLAKMSADTSIRHGTHVRVKEGPFQHNVGVVTWSDRTHVKMESMVFNVPTLVTVPVAHVEVM